MSWLASASYAQSEPAAANLAEGEDLFARELLDLEATPNPADPAAVRSAAVPADPAAVPADPAAIPDDDAPIAADDAATRLDASALWEAQIHNDLRRDIREREEEAWLFQSGDPVLSAPADSEWSQQLQRSPFLANTNTDSGAQERQGRETVARDLAGVAAALEDQNAADDVAPDLAEAPLDGTPAAAAALPEAAVIDLPPVAAIPADDPGDSRAVQFLTDPRFGIRALFALGALGVLALLGRTLRKHGDLAVHIIYPNELKGTFRVRAHKRRNRWKRARGRSEAELLKGGTSGTYEHFLVARETQFRRLPCRRYYLTIEGILQDPRNDAVVERPFLQYAAVVRHRRTVRAEVDATPATCVVDVRVTWDGRPIRDAYVSPRAAGHTPQEAEGGRVRLQLARGHHTIAAGSGDRVAEYPIHVRSHLPTTVEIDLARPEALVFKACPPAVEPYLLGDFDAAAEALAQDGQGEEAHRLLARRSHEEGRDAEAALHFEAAGEFVEAAELHAMLGNYAHSAELFERASDMMSAAEMYQLAGQEVRAGQAFEAAREFEKAIDCYRSAGAIANWVEILERRGETFDAARIALDHNLPTRGIRLLQRVVPDDPNYLEACILLADEFERERHYDLAARNLEDYVGASKADEVETRLYWRLAELHEKSGHLERALDILEDLRLLDPTYPNLATRAEQLRKAQSAKRYAEARMMDSDASMSPTVMLTEQRYEILQEIGRGGMGVVFRARDRRLGRIVALKRLSENLRDHPRAVELFLREAQAAASLNHPNIVTVYDADQEDGSLIITMELLDGLPLNRILHRDGRLRSAEVAAIGRDVCSALAYAHTRRVIHRDIKTANLFRTKDDVVKIMDFGLAKLLEEVRRTASVIGGTPYYMAPEQSLGAHTDHRADLYSLGVTLFELSTGKVPFPDGDAAYHNRHTTPPHPGALAPDIDPALAALILELLAKDPGDRPATAEDAQLRLEAIAAANQDTSRA